MGQEGNFDTLFGRMAVDQGFVTKEELTHSVKELKGRRSSQPVLLKDLLVELGYITPSQSDRLKKTVTESKAAAHQIPGYKILGKLGAGAMAVVYRAKQLSLNRDVAIKVLPQRFTQNPEYVERFYKEGQAAGKLNHNNIVQAFDVGEAGGYHYFVMEFVEGKTIHDDLAAGKVFSEQDALGIILQVARALKHAHSNGLIHRDIKPKNIMITKDGVVKLADMGLARETADLEAAESEKGKAYGTPYYIAPEQIRGAIDIDGRADIYGLGATFYHMVTGRLPFMAEAPADVMRKHLREQLVPPDHINTSLSAGCSEVIEVMMAKRREDRYKNVDELMVSLEALRDGQSPIKAHQRFDIDQLESLEEGEEVYVEDANYSPSAVSKYQTLVLVLGIVSGVSTLLAVILLIMLLV